MISQEEILELQAEQLQEELQRQAAQSSVSQSQQASNVDAAGFFDGALDLLDVGLDLLGDAGSATVEGACAVASCAGDIAVGAVEVTGSIIGGTFEVIGEILGG